MIGMNQYSILLHSYAVFDKTVWNAYISKLLKDCVLECVVSTLTE